MKLADIDFSQYRQGYGAFRTRKEGENRYCFFGAAALAAGCLSFDEIREKLLKEIQ